MCLPPQFGLEPTVHQSLPRQAKHQPQQQQQQQVQQVQQQSYGFPLEIAAPVTCKSEPVQYQVQQPSTFDFQSYDPLHAFDFNTNFVLPCDDDLFNIGAPSCDDVLSAPTWPLNASLEDLILPSEQLGEPLADQPQLFGTEDLSSFFSDSSSNKSFAALSPEFSSSDSGFAPVESILDITDVKPALNVNGKKRKTRKRRLARDLNPVELARTREVNRIAAQRHRKLLKFKRGEQETKYAELCRKNTELRETLRTLTAESRALTRIVVDIFTPKTGIPAAPSWDAQQMNAYLPSFSSTQPQVFC